MSRTSTARPRSGQPTGSHPSGRARIVGALVALSAGALLGACAQTTIASALPGITGDIGTVVNLSWPVTAYLVTEAVAVLVFLKLIAIDNPRPVYVVAMATFVSGAVVAGLSPTLGQLIVSRAIQGIGAGGLLAMGFEVVGELVSPPWRVRYRSGLAVLWAVGTLLGPFLGGVITQHMGWRWVFYVNAPIGALVLLAVVAGLRLPRRSREGELDLVGALLLTLELVLVLLYVAWQGPLHGWATSGGLVVLAEAVAALMLLLAWENRVKEPLLPLRLLSRSGFSRVTVIAVLAGSALFGILTLFPLHAQVVLRMTPTWAGILLLPIMIGVLVGVTSVFPRAWHRPLIVFGIGTVLVSTLLLALLPVDSARWRALVLAFTAGLGLGTVWRAAMRIARSAAPPEEARKAISTMLFLQIAGCAVGAALAGSALSLRLAQYHGADLVNAPGLGPDAIRALPGPDRAAVLGAFQHAGQQVLVTAVVITAVALVLSLTVPKVALRSNKVLAEGEPEPLSDAEAEQGGAEKAAVEPNSAPPEPAESDEPADTGPVWETVAEREPTRNPEPLARSGDVPEETEPPGPEPVPRPVNVDVPATKHRRSHVRRLALVCCVLSAILAAGYVGGLIYAGPGVLRGTTVNGVDIGGLQPAQAETKLDRTLGPAAAATIPVQAGNQRLSLDPHNAGLGIDVHSTVAATARRTSNPIRLADILLHAPRKIGIRTTVDEPQLNAALVQIDHQVHRDPRNGTVAFESGMPQAVLSQNGQSLDMPRSTTDVRNGYLRGPIALPLTILRPKVSNNEVWRAMHEFAEPAVSGPVVVSADGKTATLQPSVFAPHLSMTADDNGRLHPALDGAGVLSDGAAELGPLQTQPQAGGFQLMNGKWVHTPPTDGRVIRAEDLSGSMLQVLSKQGYRVAYVQLTTVHP